MLVPNLDPMELAVFTRAAKTLNFAAVAKELHLSPPAVTKIISSLEEKLRRKLFWRTTRSVQITPEGERFLEVAKAALQSLECAQNFLEEEAGDPESLTGNLRIACSYTLAIRRVSKLLASFHLKYPNLKVELHLSDQQVDLVEEGLDMAVRLMRFEDSTFIARKLAENPVRFYASKDYIKRRGIPKTVNALKDHCILYIPIHGTLKFKKCGKTLTKVAGASWLHSVSGDVLVAMATQGSGILVRSAWGAEDEVINGSLQEIKLSDELVSTSSIYAVYPQNRFLPRRVRLWIDHLVEGFAECV